MSGWIIGVDLILCIVIGYALGRAHARWLLADEWSRIAGEWAKAQQATIEGMELMDRWRRRNGEVIP